MNNYLILSTIGFLIILIVSSLWSSMCRVREGMENETNNDTNDDTNDDTNGNSDAVQEDVFADTNEPTTNDGEIKPYNTDNPSNALILAQQNAGNILSLQDQMKTIKGMDSRLSNLEATVKNQQDQINGLVEQQAQYAQDISAKEPVEITGV